MCDLRMKADSGAAQGLSCRDDRHVGWSGQWAAGGGGGRQQVDGPNA